MIRIEPPFMWYDITIRFDLDCASEASHLTNYARRILDEAGFEYLDLKNDHSRYFFEFEDESEAVRFRLIFGEERTASQIFKEINEAFKNIDIKSFF